jgi:hypothetical protein
MPNTLIPIQTYTLTSSASSITFSNIPQNYTDLKIVVSARNASSNPGYQRLSMLIQLNGSTSTFTSKFLSSSSPPSSFSFSNGTIGWIPASDAAANTFSNTEINILNYTSSNNKSYYVDNAQTNNATTYNHFNISLVSGLWSTVSAITSVGFTFESGSNIVSGSTFTLYGVSNGVKATGGTLTVAGGYAYHTFTSTGSFLPSQKITGAEILAIAGGGGGGGDAGGGGGAGGVLYSYAQTLNAGNAYTALVGSGGAGGNGTSGVKGSSSQLSVISAEGGGWGARGLGDSSTAANGGSGGGGSGRGQSSGVNPAGGTATSGQGNNGGSGFGESTTGNQSGGGGGGAGGVGANSSSAVGGSGGVGTTNYTTWHSITGTGVLSSSLYYIAGGGGGSVYSGGTMGSGGTGGGGGAGNGGTAGTANTGGGGGAARVSYSGGAGGSGLIIVRYPLS